MPYGVFEILNLTQLTSVILNKISSEKYLEMQSGIESRPQECNVHFISGGLELSSRLSQVMKERPHMFKNIGFEREFGKPR